jgi:hypothetical protein
VFVFELSQNASGFNRFYLWILGIRSISEVHVLHQMRVYFIYQSAICLCDETNNFDMEPPRNGGRYNETQLHAAGNFSNFQQRKTFVSGNNSHFRVPKHV